ncbi:DUF5331 domain-containing protein [aff. Roholtiella sp. LEGE 12411]|uniref:DUF5331 domain-containing protein n=1 Tax=aff. Roholtiella sp. LEGE 12411 TaxID=1828822 RepID=UPI0030D95097
MNIQQLRQSLKQKWLSYYEQNCPWLVKMRIWGTYDDVRRPLSGFILATLSVLEPQFDEILNFIVGLSNNPDKIVAALGLNFNPDEELRLIKLEHSVATNQVEHESSEEISSEKNEDVSFITTVNHVAPSVASAKLKPVVHEENPQTLTDSLPLHRPTALTLRERWHPCLGEDSTVSPADKTLNSQKLPSDLPRIHKLVPLFAVTTEAARAQKPVPAIAVATKIIPEPPAKSPAALLREKQARLHHERLSSGASLTIPAQVPSKAKTMPFPALFIEDFSNTKQVCSCFDACQTLLQERLPSAASLAITTEIPPNGKHLNIQPQDVKKKTNLSLSTNAHSLASWVDEFCHGTGRDGDNDANYGYS